MAALAEHPEVWNTHRARTVASGPHRHVDDIWARFAPPGVEIDPFEPHVSEWYPVADVIRLRPLVDTVMRMVGGRQLGGVLVTRVPPGKCVLPHVDNGWHARYYEKFAVQLAGNEQQAFCFHDEALMTERGDLYTFDNAFEHWVTNCSDLPRITAIICIRRNDASD